MTFYITTPLYYVNGNPHIGHAYTTIIADIMARYHRLKGDENVYFSTGTDEHGLKVQRAAERLGIEPKEMADNYSSNFQKLFDQLEITYDRFIRTTDPQHKENVLGMIERMKKSGDIYLAKYAGWYSESDEAYYKDSEVEGGVSLISGSPVEWIEEESYFFRLEKYQNKILKWYTQNDKCILPSTRKNEMVSFVNQGLKDLSISRTTFEWGIPWPDDPDHVLYVWVDALTNYLTASNGLSNQEVWPADIHFIGKDILRFHAVYWPAFLMSAGLPLPQTIFAHGWWLRDGSKMGKSVGNFISSEDLSSYDIDVLRYYMVREMPLGRDGDFSHKRILARNNSELVNNLGNLVNRTFSMTEKFLDGNLPNFLDPQLCTELDLEIMQDLKDLPQKVDAFMENIDPHGALELLMESSSELNKFIQKSQPWSYDKEDERLPHILYIILESIRLLTALLSPFLPEASTKTLVAMRSLGKPLVWGIPFSHTLNKELGVLFSRIEK